MVAYLAWLAEALLEAAGAYFLFRRRFVAIWLWLGFRAAADLVCFVLLNAYSFKAYQWADYSQRHAQYFLFAAACTYSAWKILRDNTSPAWYFAGISALIGLAVARVHAVWPLSPRSVLSLETWAEMLLAAFVAFSLGMARGKAPKPWGLIGCALVVMGGSDGLVTLLRQKGWEVEGWYPVGAVIGLGMLLWAAAGRFRLGAARMTLGMKKPPTSVGAAEIFKMFG